LAHEDLAILLGGYMVVNKLMPVGLVAISIYGGMVASDLSLYAIGAGARRIPWLNRLAVNSCVVGFGDTLQRKLFGLAALSRVVPGVVFVVMIASGWTRVPLWRFTLASLTTCALYLPLMLYLIVVFGDALDDRVGLWTWPFLLGVVAAIAFMRYRVFTFGKNGVEAESAPTRRLRGDTRTIRSRLGHSSPQWSPESSIFGCPRARYDRFDPPDFCSDANCQRITGSRKGNGVPSGTGMRKTLSVIATMA
jgi:membrane protein DedA with SNARE-associated domain